MIRYYCSHYQLSSLASSPLHLHLVAIILSYVLSLSCRYQLRLVVIHSVLSSSPASCFHHQCHVPISSPVIIPHVLTSSPATYRCLHLCPVILTHHLCSVLIGQWTVLSRHVLVWAKLKSWHLQTKQVGPIVKACQADQLSLGLSSSPTATSLIPLPWVSISVSVVLLCCSGNMIMSFSTSSFCTERFKAAPFLFFLKSANKNIRLRNVILSTQCKYSLFSTPCCGRRKTIPHHSRLKKNHSVSILCV